MLLKRTIGVLLLIVLTPVVVISELTSAYYTDWTLIDDFVVWWHRTFWLAPKP